MGWTSRGAHGVAISYQMNIHRERPHLLLASYCAAPCPLMGMNSACVGKNESPTALLHALQAVLAPGDRGREAA